MTWDMRSLISLFEGNVADRVDQMVREFKRAWAVTGAAAGFHVSLIPRETSCEIDTIWNQGVSRRGVGRIVMRMLTGFADAYQVPLSIHVHPLHYDVAHHDRWETVDLEDKNAHHLTAKQLRVWYEGLGFEVLAGSRGDAVRMIRRPRPV